jgi:aromatic ring hydroxylase
MYMHNLVEKELWDVLNTKFGGTYASSEMYIMGSFHGYKIESNRSIVE